MKAGKEKRSPGEKESNPKKAGRKKNLK